MTQTNIKEQAGALLSQVAGYVGVRTMEIGLRLGLIEALADEKEGLSASELAAKVKSDPFYTRVWCRAAYAAKLVEAEGAEESEGYDPAARDFESGGAQRFRLAPHIGTLLLDTNHPAYIGGMPKVLTQPEIFDVFAEKLPSGDRIWWNDCSPEFIDGVSGTGVPFYTRMVPGGFEEVPGLSEVLKSGARVTELCVGAGRGLERLAKAYPKCSFTGVDGDAYSLKLAKQHLADSGVTSEVTFVESALEEFDLSDQDVVFINISMHECRDIDAVTQNVKKALKPGGIFVISDFPFPETTAACRTVPGQILSGIQFFEALIGDQLMPTKAFVELLGRHGFEGVTSFDMTPVHAVTYGRR